MNRFAWDLRYDDPVQTPGAFYSETGRADRKSCPAIIR